MDWAWVDVSSTGVGEVEDDVVESEAVEDGVSEVEVEADIDEVDELEDGIEESELARSPPDILPDWPFDITVSERDDMMSKKIRERDNRDITKAIEMADILSYA